MLGIFALGVLIVLLSGGIDISFTAVAALSMYVTSKVLLAADYSGSVVVAFVIAGCLGLLLGLSRHWSGREALLASWEADIRALDERLREFYGPRIRDFLICCGFHFLGWVLGCWEVYVVLWLLGRPVDFPSAFAIEALSGVAKLAAVIVPGSLGVQEGGQVLIFVAFGLGAPLAVTFGLLRRGRELLWIGFGLGVLVHRRALGWLKRRAESLEPRAETRVER